MQKRREESEPSLERIFKAFSDARTAEDPSAAYLALQKEFTAQAPKLITLGVLTLKDSFGMLADIDQKINTSGGDGISAEDRIRQFLGGEGSEATDDRPAAKSTIRTGPKSKAS